LSEWAKANNVRRPIVPGHCDQAYHMYYLVMPSVGSRQQLIAHLKGHGILAVFHYQPLHLSDMGRRYDAKASNCPVSEMAGDCLLRLPFFNDLALADQNRVVKAVRDYHCG